MRFRKERVSREDQAWEQKKEQIEDAMRGALKGVSNQKEAQASVNQALKELFPDTDFKGPLIIMNQSGGQRVFTVMIQVTIDNEPKSVKVSYP